MESRQAVQQDHVIIAGLRDHFHIDLVRRQQFDPLRKFILFTHRYPYIGVKDISRVYAFGHIGRDFDFAAALFSEFLCHFDQFIGREKRFRCADRDVHTQDGACHQQAVGDIVASVAYIDQFQAGQLAEMLFDRQEIGDHLGRMPFVSQPVPYRHTCIFRQIFDRFLAEAAEFDTVKHAAEHFGGVFNGFLFAQLDIIFSEVFGMCAQIDGSHRECGSCAR